VWSPRRTFPSKGSSETPRDSLPDDSFLSDEPGNFNALHQPRVWMVDPIDRGQPFLVGLSGWCTSIAYVLTREEPCACCAQRQANFPPGALDGCAAERPAHTPSRRQHFGRWAGVPRLLQPHGTGFRFKTPLRAGCSCTTAPAQLGCTKMPAGVRSATSRPTSIRAVAGVVRLMLKRPERE
jgi:hypothetical protein